MNEWYGSYQIRTLCQDGETFNQGKQRIIDRAKELGFDIRWRKGKGRLGITPRYHFWDVKTREDATLLLLACGDKVI